MNTISKACWEQGFLPMDKTEFFLTFSKLSCMNINMIGKKKDKKIEADIPPEKSIPGEKKQEKASGRKLKDPVKAEPLAEGEKKPKKSRKNLKRAIIGVLILAILASAGFMAYKIFSGKKPGRSYVAQELPHITLPAEMMKFSFENFPDLYDAFLLFEIQITLLDREIERIETIGTTYPDQAAIAKNEKKIWEELRKNSVDSFKKIENRVKAIYVTFQVNQESGKTKINEEKTELANDAKGILEPVTALTQRLKASEEVPRGLIRKTIYKLKQLFL